MRRDHYTDQQIASALQQAETGTPAPGGRRKTGVSGAAYHTRPGKPADNAHAEACNARFRAERPSQHRSLDLDGARAKVERWRVDYDAVRPHSAIRDGPPIALFSAPERLLGGATKSRKLSHDPVQLRGSGQHARKVA